MYWTHLGAVKIWHPCGNKTKIFFGTVVWQTTLPVGSHRYLNQVSPCRSAILWKILRSTTFQRWCSEKINKDNQDLTKRAFKKKEWCLNSSDPACEEGLKSKLPGLFLQDLLNDINRQLRDLCGCAKPLIWRSKHIASRYHRSLQCYLPSSSTKNTKTSAVLEFHCWRVLEWHGWRTS